MKGHPDLNPCPFCGSEEVELEIETEWRTTRYRPRCWGCTAQLESCLSAEAAKQAWNRREIPSLGAAQHEGGEHGS
jgi:Lar family restriction alleviation protein